MTQMCCEAVLRHCIDNDANAMCRWVLPAPYYAKTFVAGDVSCESPQSTQEPRFRWQEIQMSPKTFLCTYMSLLPDVRMMP